MEINTFYFYLRKFLQYVLLAFSKIDVCKCPYLWSSQEEWLLCIFSVISDVFNFLYNNAGNIFFILCWYD